MNAQSLMQVLQFTDSTFPVGTFSFSNGLETAAMEGLVHNAATLEAFTRAASVQAAMTDGVAALAAFRAASNDNFEDVAAADLSLYQCKMNDEARLMLTRMGKKLAELASRLFPGHEILTRFLNDINAGILPGTYPAAQGIVFSINEMDEEELFCSHQYGVINMILSAALRCVRVSHYDTQAILLRLCSEALDLWPEVQKMKLEDMNAFVPQMDICASLHEKGKMRMFMN